MAKPLRLPGMEEQRVLDGLAIQLPLDREQKDRWNNLVIQEHYLENATLVREQLRSAVSYQGQWLALLGWSVPAWHLQARAAWIKLVGGSTPPPVAFSGSKQPFCDSGRSHAVS